jgi:AcrR family transcriptional regulator
MAKKKPDIRKKLVTAALGLAASHAWERLTLEQIAKAAKVSATETKKLFPNVNDVLVALVARVDDEVATAIRRPLSKGTARDRLFEVMMARFDILQKHRSAFLKIIAAIKRDPSLARILLPAQTQAMQKMLTLAGLKQDGVKQLMATTGLMVIYGASLHGWERDESKDMARTMAALDRYLRYADKGAEILFRTF